MPGFSMNKNHTQDERAMAKVVEFCDVASLDNALIFRSWNKELILTNFSFCPN